MPIIVFPGAGRPEPCPIQSQALNAAAERAVRKALGPPVRRRGSLEQGRALEALGHAVEYVIDSRLFNANELNPRDEQEAVQILMRMSRAVFLECPEVVPVRRRLRQWIAEWFAGDGEIA